MERTKFILDEKDLPTHWYNVLPDLPEPLPPLVHPGTKEPLPREGPLPPPLFPDAINKQEFVTESYLAIPEEFRETSTLWRPSPRNWAYGLGHAHATPAQRCYTQQ